MRLLFLLVLSVCAIIADFQIYRKIRRGRAFFLGYAAAVDVLIFAVIFLGFGWPFYGPRSVSPFPLWLAWFFFLNTAPKCVWLLLYVMSGATGRRVGRWLRRLGVVLAAYVALILVKGAFYNIGSFAVKPVVIESAKIPPAFDGYSMALFSDVHLGNLSRQERFLRRAVEQINRLHPDIILHAGDLVNMYAAEITPAVQAVLGQLQAPDGVYSVLGNHDMGPYFGKRAIRAGLTPSDNTRSVLLRQQEMGWRVLQNESVHIHRGADSIGLCGVPYPPLPPRFPDSLTNFDPLLATDLLGTEQFNVMLCHTPVVWESLFDAPALTPVDLVLSGHTHAMQVKISIGRRQWSPAGLMYTYWSGLYERKGRYLYVNEGLGYVLYPMRIGSRPEITLLTLRRKP